MRLLVVSVICIHAVQHKPVTIYVLSHSQTLTALLGVWSSPNLIGERPPPSAYFSFTKVDQDRAVLLGGQRPGAVRVNELFLFDFKKMVSLIV